MLFLTQPSSRLNDRQSWNHYKVVVKDIDTRFAWLEGELKARIITVGSFSYARHPMMHSDGLVYSYLSITLSLKNVPSSPEYIRELMFKICRLLLLSFQWLRSSLVHHLTTLYYWLIRRCVVVLPSFWGMTTLLVLNFKRIQKVLNWFKARGRAVLEFTTTVLHITWYWSFYMYSFFCTHIRVCCTTTYHSNKRSRTTLFSPVRIIFHFTPNLCLDQHTIVQCTFIPLLQLLRCVLHMKNHTS